MKKYIYLAIVALVAMCSCTGNQFKVDGKIDGATDSVKVVLEQSSNGMWFVVDSVQVGKDGSFAVSADAPEYPNIYRLRLGEQSICFPIDSLDHITVNSRLAAFATDYTLAGSEHAEQVMKIDKEALSLAGGKGTSEQLKAFKDRLAKQIIVDPAGIVAYYVINKYVGDTPLYDPSNDDDLKIIGAVANSFNTFRPNDPRTQYLVNVLLQGQQRRRAGNEPSDTIQANETAIIDINLDDYNGKKHSLTQVASQHRVVLLNYTMYVGEFSPVFNKLLNDIYKANKAAGLEIYQISLDTDNVAWLQAARNLPWITVYDPASINSVNVGNYQVMQVPTTFIIKNGEIVERIEDANKLQAAVARHM